MDNANKSNKLLFDLIVCFLVFLGLAGLTCTICVVVFVHNTGVPEDIIKRRAIITLICVTALSVVYTVLYFLQRYFIIEKPLKRVLDATQKMRRGDFSVRVEKNKIPALSPVVSTISDDINSLAAELEGVEILKTDFISAVSHELKTPLAIIQNYATMLEVPELSDKERMEYAKVIVQSTKRFSELITNLLKLNKLENQQIYSQSHEYDLGEQLCQCLLDFETVWEEKNLEIETDIDQNTYINSDEELLGLVWNNIISNAVKFTEPGGRITVSVKKISTEENALSDEEMKEDAEREKSRQKDKKKSNLVQVSISDTGCGISPKTGAHIFDKFYQGDTSHSVQGNGLGLSLVKKVMDITGGEISVFSEVGKGSTFTVKLSTDAAQIAK